MNRRDFLQISLSLGVAAMLRPALAWGAYSGPLRRDYENWALLCLRIEKSRNYYADLYRRAVSIIAASGAPYERIRSASQSHILNSVSTEFYYGQPSWVFSTRIYVDGNDPMGYLMAANLRGTVLRPTTILGDMYGDRFDRHWPVDGHVGATRNRVSANSHFDFFYSPGYLAAPAGMDKSAVEWSGGHEIEIDEMLIVPGSSLKALPDAGGYLSLFRSMAKTPPMSVLPTAGILRSEIS